MSPVSSSAAADSTNPDQPNRDQQPTPSFVEMTWPPLPQIPQNLPWVSGTPMLSSLAHFALPGGHPFPPGLQAAPFPHAMMPSWPQMAIPDFRNFRPPMDLPGSYIFPYGLEGDAHRAKRAPSQLSLDNHETSQSNAPNPSHPLAVFPAHMLPLPSTAGGRSNSVAYLIPPFSKPPPTAHNAELNSMYSPIFAAASISPSRTPPELTELPSPEVVNRCIDAYFKFADITYAMLHRGRFSESQPSKLLLSTILLVTPLISSEPIEGTTTREESDEWSKSYFHLAKSELLAALGTDSGVAIETAAAVANLYLFAMLKGLTSLSRDLHALAKKLVFAMGLVADPESYAAPAAGIPSWSQTLEEYYLSRAQSLNLTAKHEDARTIRSLWIDYWTRERVVQLIGLFNWATKDWLRAVAEPHAANKRLPHFADLARPIPPMNGVWEASLDPNFDPRSVALQDSPRMRDVVAPLLMDAEDPERPAALQRLTHYMLTQRKAVAYCFYVLRDRVDGFLVACREAGFPSPATLHLDASQATDPRLQSLLQLRNSVDEAICTCRDAFPDSIKMGLRNGSASDVLAALVQHSSSFHYAFNHVTFFPAIVLLRLELYSSCGVYLTVESHEGTGEGWHGTTHDTLADEFGRSSQLFAGLLEDVLLFTRLLEEWRMLNPSFKNHLEATMTLAFRICCLHASFYNKFKKSINAGGSAAGSGTEVLSTVESDMATCLNVLGMYARRAPWGQSIYNIAKKMSLGEAITLSELREVRQGPEYSKKPQEEPNGESAGRQTMEVEADKLRTTLGMYLSVGSSASPV